MHGRFRKRNWFRFALLAIVGIALASLVVMLLWNWLAPAVFGLTKIHYLQAIGLLILSRILFRGQPNIRGHWRRHMEQRWQEMAPEERENFRAGMWSCWGRGKYDESTPKEEAK
ncbi:MAG: hypothetical protein GC149_07160 [Gammaproteobacteria bacterium]|nr:hypothetical protein [Gammaproteobacteria bacterium]